MQNIHMFLVLYTMLFNVFLAYLSLLKVIFMSLACLRDFVN